MTVSEITTVELSNVQLALMRQLVFSEMRAAAKVLAEKAELAAGPGADEDNIAGDDAAATFRYRVEVVAKLLDKLGWSVLTDEATIVEYERARKTSEARARKASGGA